MHGNHSRNCVLCGKSRLEGFPTCQSAKRHGKRKGRPPALNQEKTAQIVAALEIGTSKDVVCRTFGVPRSTLFDNLSRIGWTGVDRADQAKLKRRHKLDCGMERWSLADLEKRLEKPTLSESFYDGLCYFRHDWS